MIRLLVPVCIASLLAVCIAWGGGRTGAAGEEAEDDRGGAPPRWRSALYPENWTPELTDGKGRFLPDFSYAGYRNGEVPLPTSADLPVVDVVADHGADPTGQTDATAAFQAALDVPCAHVVRVPEGLFRCDGLLTATRSNVVLRGEGAAKSRVHFTRHAGMTGRAHVTFRGALSFGAEVLLAQDGVTRSREVFVEDASGLAEGQDVAVGWVITDAFVAEHGMAGTWRAFNGSWQTFFRRQVEAIDTTVSPHRVTLDVPLRYAARTRDAASLRVESGYLSEVGVRDVGLANAVAWSAAWANERVHVLEFDAVKDGWVTGVATFVSPAAPASGYGAGAHLQSGGLLVKRSKRITVADCRMVRAQHRGGGGCGYLFEVMQAGEILTRDCTARAGRHNFIQNWGFGTTGCVWLRCTSTQGFALVSQALPTIGQTGYSEYHHSLAMANLVDGGQIDDGWSASNRGTWSSGAGHSATGCVFWNVGGTGVLRSQQYGWGYVVGTRTGLHIETALGGRSAAGSAPEDWVEGMGAGATLAPASLYEDQLQRRTRSQGR